MKPLPFIWPYSLAFWLVYIWAYFPEFLIILRSKKGAAKSNSTDAGSIQLLIFIQMIALALAFILSFRQSTRLPASWQPFCLWFGLIVLCGGSLLRRHCWKLLGTYFTGDVQVHTGQVVIDKGAYAWVRHPSYTAGILMFVGISISLGSWASILMLTIPVFLAFQYRMKVEERALEVALGEPYREFLRTRKRLIPYIY